EGADRVSGSEFASLGASLLSSAAGSLGFAGDFEAAVPIATRSLELARASGRPASIVTSLWALAQALADRAPDPPRALLRRAVEYTQSRSGFENNSIGMTLVAARLTDWPLTAQLARRSIPLLHWNNERPMLAGILNVSARVLTDTDPEAAGV